MRERQGKLEKERVREGLREKQVITVRTKSGFEAVKHPGWPSKKGVSGFVGIPLLSSDSSLIPVHLPYLCLYCPVLSTVIYKILLYDVACFLTSHSPNCFGQFQTHVYTHVCTHQTKVLCAHILQMFLV